MRELDILLDSFIQRNNKRLQNGEFPDFELFLNEEDDQLWTWLQGNDVPDNPGYHSLIRTIRRAK